MIKEAVEFLQGQLRLTGLFSQVYGLCELINKDDKTYPAIYVGSGEYKPVTNFDENNGTAYFRKTGNTNKLTISNEQKTTSCESLLQFSFPLRLICVINKSKAECDDNYAADIFAEKIAFQLENASGLGTELNAVSATCSVVNYNTVGSEILKNEYRNPSVNEFNFNFAYLSIDIDIVIIKDPACIDDLCY